MTKAVSRRWVINREKPILKNRVVPELEAMVVKMALDQPA